MSASEVLPNPTQRNLVWRVIQIFFKIFSTIWLRLRVQGKERLPTAGGALLLANHQSFLDPLLIGVALTRPISFLARDNLFRVPCIGWILKNTYVMSIRREAAGTESIRKTIARLEHGFYVGLFPEGTRTQDGKVGFVKPGFVALARRSQVPIVPVGIAGAFQAMPRKSLFIRPCAVRVVYGEPISVEQVRELSVKGREAEFIQLVTDRITAAYQQAELWRTGKQIPT